MRFRLFYGWYIVAAGFFLSAFYGAIFIYGYTAFVNPIITTFGWTLTQVSLASSLRTLETGVFNPLWGVVIDRWSPRKLMLFGMIATGAGTLVISQTANLPMFYGGFLVMGLGSSLVTGMLPTTIIARWFRKDLGKANSILTLGWSISGISIPVIVFIIDHFGWQSTLMYAGIMWLFLLPWFSAAVLRITGCCLTATLLIMANRMDLPATICLEPALKKL